MTPPRFIARNRALALVLSAALALSGCVTTSGGSENLTPAQRQLRQQTERFNETVATGALVGALLGCALGAAIDKNDRGRGCAAGGVVGGVTGAGSGYYVATRNQTYATREQAAQARITAAQREAEDLSRTAAIADQVTRENLAQIERLDRSFKARQLSAAQYRAQTESMRTDLQAIRSAAEGAGKSAQALAADSAGPGGPVLSDQAMRVAQAKRRLDGSVNALEEALKRVPAA